MKILITGGSGFFGSFLKARFRQGGHDYVNLDQICDSQDARDGRMAMVDLCHAAEVESIFEEWGPFDVVCHVAAELAHEVRNPTRLWKSNVEGTRNVAESCKKHGVKKLIFISTNCLWGKPFKRPVVEGDTPAPIEIYGRSKLAAEKLLQAYRSCMDIVIFRSSTIIAPGRVGLLGILFDFISEGRRIPVVSTENQPYQFIDAEDYASAILLALDHQGSDIFHVGSHEPVPLEESYAYVIEQAGSSSRLYRVPKFPTLPLMRLCHVLNISPLGPYHYHMIAERFVFDTTHAEKTLGWKPTKTNGEILYAAFTYYIQHKAELESSHHRLPAHRRKSRFGVLRLLKWVS